MSDQSELRERLARYLAGADGHAWDDVFPRVPWEVFAENVIAEIEQAGCVIVPGKRWTAIQGLVVLMRMAFDCGADSPEGCGTTDGQIWDRIMATLEMVEAEVSGDLEGEAMP